MASLIVECVYNLCLVFDRSTKNFLFGKGGLRVFTDCLKLFLKRERDKTIGTYIIYNLAKSGGIRTKTKAKKKLPGNLQLWISPPPPKKNTNHKRLHQNNQNTALVLFVCLDYVST